MLPEHDAKVRESLALLEEAKSLVNRAALALGAIYEFSDQWAKLTELTHVVERRRRDLERRRDVVAARAKPGKRSAPADEW